MSYVCVKQFNLKWCVCCFKGNTDHQHLQQYMSDPLFAQMLGTTLEPHNISTTTSLCIVPCF